MKLTKKTIESLKVIVGGWSLDAYPAHGVNAGIDACVGAVLTKNQYRRRGDKDADDHLVHLFFSGFPDADGELTPLDPQHLSLSLPDAMNLADAINRMAWASFGAGVFREAMRFKTYAISLDEIKTLADTAAQLDHVKNFLPDCAARDEAATLAVQAHATLERILGDDVALVYAPCDEEETPA